MKSFPSRYRKRDPANLIGSQKLRAFQAGTIGVSVRQDSFDASRCAMHGRNKEQTQDSPNGSIRPARLKKEDAVMGANFLVKPMTEEFILWRCLHSGPLSPGTIDQFPANNPLDWHHYRQRNIPLLLKLTRTYGACAIIARQDDQVVGMLRFYPKVVGAMKGAGYLCLQQDSPAGPDDEFADQEFPPLAAIQDKTLTVHCLMTGSSQQKENPFQRKGLGTQLARALIDWARARGWRHIEADSFEDLPMIYEITGSTGHTFWEKLGFRLVDRHPHPHLQEESEFSQQLLEQARAMGLSPDKARDQLLMRLDLA